MLAIAATKIKEARSEGRRRLEWFANVDGQVALCATWPRPNLCFTEVFSFALQDGSWVNTNPFDELGVVCT
jgi:hypothetical protein